MEPTMITVTKTFFPPITEYQTYLERIWQNQWLTNNGELFHELSSSLKSYLGVNHILPMTNGTLPLQIALKTFAQGGEVITTPFSYVATTSSIVWENCTPIFVDIHPEYLCIDETKIEAAITSKTTAILATHVFGNPCHIAAIERLASKHHLKVIYDAAHCFGVRYKGESIFNFGDVSTCSFHATKLFHTGEGGAAFVQNEKDYHEIYYRHNFGHDGPLRFHGLGINAKMSELQAAMGLSVLPHMPHILDARAKVCAFYDKALTTTRIQKLKIREGTDWNYSYYPIIFETEEDLLQVEKAMNQEGIYPRRYFYPSLENLPYIQTKTCPIAHSIASRVMCLPLYVGLNKEDLKKIVSFLC